MSRTPKAQKAGGVAHGPDTPLPYWWDSAGHISGKPPQMEAYGMTPQHGRTVEYGRMKAVSARGYGEMPPNGTTRCSGMIQGHGMMGNWKIFIYLVLFTALCGCGAQRPCAPSDLKITDISSKWTAPGGRKAQLSMTKMEDKAGSSQMEIIP